jgi:hypothetical protein
VIFAALRRSWLSQLGVVVVAVPLRI